MLVWIGRFLIAWPFAIMFGLIGYGFYQMSGENKIAIGFLTGGILSIIAGVALTEKYRE